MNRDPILALWEQLRDWTYENYGTAYLVGTWVIIYSVTFPSIQAALLLWLLATGLGYLLKPGVDPASQLYGSVVCRGRSSQPPQVALTFDDGPDPVITTALLDLLAREHVLASFFLIGQQAQAHPEVVARMAAEGHLVGNHTQTHANLMACSPQRSEEEIRLGAASIAQGLGRVPAHFRPPFGFRFPWTLRQARRQGQTPVLWSLNPRDFHDPGAGVIVARVMEQVQPGSVVLLHDGPRDRHQTLEAVGALIAALRERGFRLVRVDQLD